MATAPLLVAAETAALADRLHASGDVLESVATLLEGAVETGGDNRIHLGVHAVDPVSHHLDQPLWRDALRLEQLNHLQWVGYHMQC